MVICYLKVGLCKVKDSQFCLFSYCVLLEAQFGEGALVHVMLVGTPAPVYL